MPSVEIGPGPTFGHIFMYISFSKIAKITMKYMISTDIHDEYENYERCWPSGQMLRKIKAFGLNMLLWPMLGFKPHQNVSWPSFGHLSL